MSVFERDGVSLRYEVAGQGYPLILIAPGGMHSVAQLWKERPASPGVPMPWIDPREVLADRFTVISLDVRNAGGSRGPVAASDGWGTYARDHLALVDHLGFETFHAMGGCIGSSHVLAVCNAAPGRVSAAVLQNPIGLSAHNRDRFTALFDEWAAALRPERDDLSEEALAGFRRNLFGGDFVFSVTRDFVSRCPVPFLVLAGDDEFHPTPVAEEISRLAPDAELVYEWAGQSRHRSTAQLVGQFLAEHTPGQTPPASQLDSA